VSVWLFVIAGGSRLLVSVWLFVIAGTHLQTSTNHPSEKMNILTLSIRTKPLHIEDCKLFKGLAISLQCSLYGLKYNLLLQQVLAIKCGVPFGFH